VGLFGSILKGVGSIAGGVIAGNAKKKASKLELQGIMAGVDEERRQFDTTRADFAPILQAGTAALGQQGDILGLNGDPAQSAAMEALRASPFFQSIFRTGEEAVLQNASATGGIRGGNVQRGLADFGADAFMQTIREKLAQLGGISGMGADATGALGGLGGAASANIANLLGQGGRSRAAGILGSSNALSGGINSALKELGPYLEKLRF
jgi:hypothetical protein